MKQFDDYMADKISLPAAFRFAGDKCLRLLLISLRKYGLHESLPFIRRAGRSFRRSHQNGHDLNIPLVGRRVVVSKRIFQADD
jgi:hypothetical protein